MTKNVGLRLLAAFIKYILYTGYVKDATRPVSCLVIANPERGKSSEAQRFKGRGIAIIQDMTSFGIDRYLLELTENELAMIHHIVIPDLEKLKTRSRSVREELMAKMRIAMDEGILEVCTGTDRVSFRKPIQIGFVMCTTPDDLGDKRSVFRSLSWQSRIIPFTYEISEKLKARILNFIENENHNQRQKKLFKRKEKVDVKLPRQLAKKLDKPAKILAMKLDKFSKNDITSNTTENTKHRQRLIGIRVKENFMTLLKAIALYHDYRTVKYEHYLEFMQLFCYMNYQYNIIDDDKI
jgi:hypothetical protein